MKDSPFFQFLKNKNVTKAVSAAAKMREGTASVHKFLGGNPGNLCDKKF